jgi:hypothetical protein
MRRLLQFALAGLAVFLLVPSAREWIIYMGQGIAYGSIVGLPGREQDLALYGERAMAALKVAVTSEALAVGLASWIFTSSRTVIVRLCIAIVLATAAALLTFASIRGL